MAVTVVLMSVAVMGTTNAVAAPKSTEGAARPANEIEAKVPPDYVSLPRVHMAVEVDANSRFRTLDLEVWLHPTDAENLQVANGKKKIIVEAIKEDLASYNWEAFEDVKDGPKIARRLIEISVDRVSGVKLDDVYIKTLILR
jgi:hypothetical protein